MLRISDGKKSAVLGIGFNDRTQAFDFKVAVQDQQKSAANHTELPAHSTTQSCTAQPTAGVVLLVVALCVSVFSTEKAEKALASTPAVDLSLPKDGKIHINVNLGGSKAKKDKPKADGAAGITAGVGGLKLAPPPAAGASSSAGDKKKDNKKKEAGGPSGT